MTRTTTRLTQVARRLRVESTDAERWLWYRLRDRRLAGYKFRRQYPIGRYVVDFVCLDRKLIVELDGGQHTEAEAEAADAVRTASLEREGFRVLRFWNSDVFRETEAVLQRILQALAVSFPSP